MNASSYRTTCKPLLQKFRILTLPSQYIFSLIRLLTTNLEIHKFNFSVHGINTRHKLEVHTPSTKLTMYQNSVYYSSTKIHKIPNVTAEFVSNEKCFNTIEKLFN
jgi:hypothetical protein